MRPAALLNLHHTVHALVLTGSTAAASAVCLILEPAGGSSHPTSRPLTLFTLPA